MGLVDREIIQSRVWIDPTAPPPPDLNYKETFPITVFDAVRLDMNKVDSITLREALDNIYNELETKQTIIPAKPANYLMTYAGVSGSVGSIMMSTEIPWDKDKQSHERIPTEKAVGELMLKLGLINEDGTIIDPSTRKVRWSDIIGRPLIYEELGINTDGFMTQKAVTDAIESIKTAMKKHEEDSIGAVQSAIQRLDDHASNKNNPHGVSLGQIGGVSKEEFDFHTQEQVNPHGITPEIIGLGKVNNTADIDKPISIATQEALDAINQQIKDINDDFDNIRFIEELEYVQSSGLLISKYNDGSTSTCYIPIDGLVDEVGYDKETKDLVIYELNGTEKRVSLSDLYVRYTGSVGTHITVEIDSGSSSGDDLKNINSDEVNKLWTDGIHPSGDLFTGEDNNMSEITAEETKLMWDTGVLPDETDDIIGINLSEITNSETLDMWINGKLPFEYPDSTDDVNAAGIKIIRAYINSYSITELEMDSGSVTTRVLRDGSVTTQKIADKAVTTDKLADGALTGDKLGLKTVTNKHVADRAINGRTLFSSEFDNRILGVINHGYDPVWTLVNNNMIDNNAIESRHIMKNSVTNEKLDQSSVSTSKLENSAVTTDKISNSAVTNDKVSNGAINGLKISENVELRGIPSSTKSPLNNSDNKELPTTEWVNKKIKNNINENSNYGDRSVDGRVLFSSPTRYRVLVTLRANSDPVWDQIYHEMIADNSIDTNNIKDLSITSTKLREKVIQSRHINLLNILSDHIAEGAVLSDKIFKSNNANMILGVINENTHPIYTKVNRGMIENNAISTMQIEDHSVTASKIESSEETFRILGVGIKNTQPMWMQIYNKMISDRAIDGRTIFSSNNQDSILGVTVAGSDPAWLKINSNMLSEKVIKREHIDDGAIWQEHLQEKIIESRHIMDWTIQQNNIAPRAITGTELFTSPYPNRVLALTTSPYADPQWLQVTTEMIEDKAITREKMFQSDNPYRVLGATQAGVPPEYLVITNDFIEDDTIKPSKLVHDFILHGTPELTNHPLPTANNHQIASTMWVRNTVADMIKNMDLGWFQIQPDMIPENIIDGTKLFRSTYDGPRVIGVTKKDEDPEYILIEEDLIVDGAVTTNKLQRDIHLLGSPVLDVRPSPFASTNKGGGDLIPDCQWVLDRITEYGGSGGEGGTNIPTGTDVLDGSIITSKIQDRAVTGDKLFTSTNSNSILAVLESNTSPIYTKIIDEMLSDRSVTGRSLFTSEDSNMTLIVSNANTNPKWGKINGNMIDNETITCDNIATDAITNEKISNRTITREKIADLPLIDSLLLMDNSVTDRKIINDAVTTDKIKNGNVTSNKLQSDIVLKGHPTVGPTDIDTKSLRNITISPNMPTPEDGSDGDIWITYI